MENNKETMNNCILQLQIIINITAIVIIYIPVTLIVIT